MSDTPAFTQKVRDVHCFSRIAHEAAEEAAQESDPRIRSLLMSSMRASLLAAAMCAEQALAMTARVFDEEGDDGD